MSSFAFWRNPPGPADAPARFHLVNIVPQAELHPLKGHAEVMETVAWGLRELGHDVTHALNQIDPARVNIIFGTQLLSPEAIAALPPGSIAYNLEQISELNLSTNPVAQAIARHLRIWEFSHRNMAKWRELNPARAVVHVPVAWAPVLARIPKPAVQDIDVLIYGTTSQSRLQVFHELCLRGAASVFVCGLYGAARDDLIARSKLVLNLNVSEKFQIFEIVRVSYLLANGKAVVANQQAGRSVDPDLLQALAFHPIEGIAAACMALLRDDEARGLLEARGRAAMQRRPVTPVLEAALRASLTLGNDAR